MSRTANRMRRRLPLNIAGFTLVELLIVIGIIGLLLSILLPTLSNARQSARDVACRANLRVLMQTQFIYANAEGYLAGPTIGEGPDAQWLPKLRPYLDEEEVGAPWSDVAVCPEKVDVPADQPTTTGVGTDQLYTYGINSFMAADPWNSKLSVSGANPAQLIVMADKGVGGTDGIGGTGTMESVLRTDDGYAFWRLASGIDVVDIASKHNNFPAFRHARDRGTREDFIRDPFAETHNPTGVNAAMLDGHVESLDRRKTLVRSGHWTIGDAWNDELFIFNGGNCCN